MLRALDIFSGGGGSSYGARTAGVQIIGAVDMCPIATATFSANFPDAKVITSKLEDVNPKKFHAEIGDIDILLASPECTNHTCAKGSAPRSEESRATAMQLYRYAKEFRPRWLVMENVVHMRPWSRYGELKEALEDLGYNVQEYVLDASDFGVPQARKRLFIIGDLQGMPPETIKSGKRKIKTVADHILDPAGTWETTPLFKKGRAAATLERAERAFNEIGKKDPFLIVYYGTDGCGGWQTVDRPLRTITTVDRFAYVEPDGKKHKMRMLQVPELKRAMGFKSNYKMNHGTRREQIKLLGNGVCPPVMEEIIKKITARQYQ